MRVTFFTPCFREFAERVSHEALFFDSLSMRVTFFTPRFRELEKRVSREAESSARESPVKQRVWI